MIKTKAIFILLGKLEIGPIKGDPVLLLSAKANDDFKEERAKDVEEVPPGFVTVKELSLLKNVGIERIRFSVRIGEIPHVLFKNVRYVPVETEFKATQEESRPKGYLTAKEAATMLNLPVRSIRERGYRMSIKSGTKVNGFLFYKKEEIESMSNIIKKRNSQ